MTISDARSRFFKKIHFRNSAEQQGDLLDLLLSWVLLYAEHYKLQGHMMWLSVVFSF